MSAPHETENLPSSPQKFARKLISAFVVSLFALIAVGVYSGRDHTLAPAGENAGQKLAVRLVSPSVEAHQDDASVRVLGARLTIHEAENSSTSVPAPASQIARLHGAMGLLKILPTTPRISC